MAMAIEETIPCEQCDTQIRLDEWSTHIKQCVRRRKRPLKDMEESTVDNIPCEYCQAQIPLNDWESHSKQCADSHRRRIEQLRNGFDNEPIIEHIPCEYCDQLISVQDLERHSRRCANNNNRRADDIQNIITDDFIEAVIPCEYCGRQVSIHDWTWHLEQCANTDKKRVEDTIKRNETNPNTNLIPCEYCDKPFAIQFIQDHQTECRRKLYESAYEPGGSAEIAFAGTFPYPETWNHSSPYNLSRYTLEPGTEEYNFVRGKFQETLSANQIVQIERIQNRRWYKQYAAHKEDFIERHGNSTEQWLFHGCKFQSIDSIVKNCFNRSHAVRCAAGQGIYFATQASTSLSYTQPDANNLRHMFMARVLVGKTTAGNQSTRICPEGYDTTGGGTVFVTYHDAQAYGEYLITFR